MKTAKKSFAYLVLILGALIMVLPFFWMIISSLKTAAEVNTTPPTFWPSLWWSAVPMAPASPPRTVSVSRSRSKGATRWKS